MASYRLLALKNEDQNFNFEGLLPLLCNHFDNFNCVAVINRCELRISNF